MNSPVATPRCHSIEIMYGISTLVVQVSGAASSNAWKTSMLKGQAVKRLGKKAKKGFRGYPMATIAFYGPDNKMATKVAVAIVLAAEQEPAEPRRWISDDRDVRTDPQIAAEILTFIAEAGVMSIAMVDRIIGCPHEEGIDYEGQTCPAMSILGRTGLVDGWDAPLNTIGDHVRCAARSRKIAPSSNSRSFDHLRPPTGTDRDPGYLPRSVFPTGVANVIRLAHGDGQPAKASDMGLSLTG